ncbi:hypothetical protein [Haloglycomyces albus]|uniref:hypothetical protein n=1 Tax=Haloglycomyces albus TaxID=526067 RepID=UPI00046D1435|nr:hypothetical protein [Haloglycomyces albus]
MTSPSQSPWSQDDIASVLRRSSADYDDIPQSVERQLDRVLDNLPDSQKLRPVSKTARWTDRLRATRPRLAVATVAFSALAILVVGVVATPILLNSRPQEAPNSAVGSQDDEDDATATEEANGDSESGPEFSGPDATDEDDLGAMGDGENGDTTGETDESGGTIQRVTSGTEYDSSDNVLEMLRTLENDPAAEVSEAPKDLREMIADSSSWRDCQKAILETYALPLVADFATFDGEPAVVFLLASDSGDTAVAVGPECSDGIINELYISD